MLAVDCWVLRFNEEGDVLQSLRCAGCIIKYATQALSLLAEAHQTRVVMKYEPTLAVAVMPAFDQPNFTVFRFSLAYVILANGGTTAPHHSRLKLSLAISIPRRRWWLCFVRTALTHVHGEVCPVGTVLGSHFSSRGCCHFGSSFFSFSLSHTGPPKPSQSCNAPVKRVGSSLCDWQNVPHEENIGLLLQDFDWKWYTHFAAIPGNC